MPPRKPKAKDDEPPFVEFFDIGDPQHTCSLEPRYKELKDRCQQDDVRQGCEYTDIGNQKYPVPPADHYYALVAAARYVVRMLDVDGVRYAFWGELAQRMRSMRDLGKVFSGLEPDERFVKVLVEYEETSGRGFHETMVKMALELEQQCWWNKCTA